MIKTEVGGNFIIHERHAAQYYCIYIKIGLFQQVKIHPHGRLLLILSFLDKISLFSECLARPLSFMDCKAYLIASRW